MQLEISHERIIWNVRRLGTRLGWQGSVGIALALLAVCLTTFYVLPWAEEAADIRSKAEQLRTSVAQHRQIEASSDPGAQLAAFYQFFSGSDSITDVLATLYEIAARNNLILDRADYNLASTAKGQLQRYEINFPVRGRYVQLRDFVAQALAKNPHLALTGISFTRTTATEIGVEAQVRFVLYLKDGQ